jgi:hypothetical protein
MQQCLWNQFNQLMENIALLRLRVKGGPAPGRVRKRICPGSPPVLGRTNEHYAARPGYVARRS